MKKVLLKAGSVVTPQGVLQTDIIIADGKIKLAANAEPCDNVIDITGKYVVPGFVDIHFHGFNLFEFTTGKFDNKTQTFDDSDAAYDAGFDMLTKTMPQFGVTGFYLGTFAAPIDVLKNCYNNLAKYLAKPQTPLTRARLFGGLLEGTFLNANMAGAQNPEFILECTKEAFDSIDDKGSIKLANVVPDFGEKSIALTKYLTAKGIIVGAGHTNATFNQFADSLKAGLKYCIHFINGPTGGLYKPFNGGGAIEAVLKLDECFAEQIYDGCHISPSYVRDILKRKGADKIIGVTDSIFLTGSDVKEFTNCGMSGVVSEDGNYIHVKGKPKTLFSSNLTMNRGFKNIYYMT